MESLLLGLRAAAEPTRLRLVALAGRGAFCVMELCEILGQSQPRLSRHLKLLHEAGLLERLREGANAWFALPQGEAGRFARDLVARLPADDPVLAADRRQAARVLAERARVASDSFRRAKGDWDETRALDLPAAAIEQAILDMLPPGRIGRLLDVGTGTGGLLELVAPRVEFALGVDASRAMLALARSRLARGGLGHCAVRLADMYRLPLPDDGYDAAVLQMVLHYAEDPAGVIAEAARVLRPGGTLLVVDLAAHDRTAMAAERAHRWPGFSDAAVHRLQTEAGLQHGTARTIPGELPVTLWPAIRPAAAAENRHAAAFATADI
jgi:ArsR family transcriptional regulator